MESRIAFAGTPVFGAWVLRNLVLGGRIPRVVISQPDRPAGRGRKTVPPPVAQEAEQAGLPCIQPDDINAEWVRSRLQEEEVDVVVVAAFGQLLRPPVLEAFACINVHASLLPAYRGAAPIVRAVQDGVDETGISIMRMTEGLDEGPIALSRRVSVGLHDDAGTVGRVLAVVGAIGVEETLTGLADGTVRWVPQEGIPSYAQKVTADDRRLDPTKDALDVHNLVRALAPESGARAEGPDGLTLKVWRTWPYRETGTEEMPAEARLVGGDPGQIAVGGEQVFVGCRVGAVRLLQVQPAGRRSMSGAEFAHGYGERVDGGILSPR